MPLKMAILASGSGSNAQAIIDKIHDGILDAKIEMIFSNRPDAYVIERAKNANIPVEVLDHRDFSDREAYDLAIVELLHQYDCELIALAGYMRILSSVFTDAFRGHILNIHPAILPSFPGTHGAADALEYGVKLTGVTIHFVEEQMDSGPIIAQGCLPVLNNESAEDLQARIHKLEHRLYPQTLQWFAEKRVVCSGRHIEVLPGDKKQVIPDGDWLIWPPLEEGF